MASSSTGSRGEPRFKGTDKPDPGNNEDEVSRYAAAVGNHRIGTTAERTDFTTKGGPWIGLLWYDTSIGATFRYKGGAAGWKRDSGFILDVIPIPWAADRQYIFGGAGTPNQQIANGSVPDPGRPYRLSFNVRCEFGTDRPDTRYHLAVGTGGEYGDHLASRNVDFTSIRKGASSLLTRIDTAPTIDIYTGETRVVLQADLIEGGGFGIVEKLNRSFVVTQWAA